MQDYAKKVIDARTFPDIWKSLEGTREQIELRNAIISKTHVARQTIHNWALGKTAPVYDDTRKTITSVVNKELGVNCSYKTLFPFNNLKR